MRILDLTFRARMPAQMDNEDPDVRYAVVRDDPGVLGIVVYARIASGIAYTDGAAALAGRVLALECETRDSDTIEFELRGWELSYTVEYEGGRDFDHVTFAGRRIEPR